MAVYTSNLALTTDSDFSQIFTLENAETNSPTNLTGFTIASSIRKHPAAKRGEGFEATIINAAAGKIRLGMSGIKSRQLADEGFFRTGRYVYDVVVTDSASERTKVLEGTVLVNIGVTKIPRDTVYPPT
jgi:hypothetical protein|tara:strand:- start:276 stop:662 length:387 start_codon:yes stop_codon:yes gene_type:complete